MSPVHILECSNEIFQGWSSQTQIFLIKHTCAGNACRAHRSLVSWSGAKALLRLDVNCSLSALETTLLSPVLRLLRRRPLSAASAKPAKILTINAAFLFQGHLRYAQEERKTHHLPLLPDFLSHDFLNILWVRCLNKRSLRKPCKRAIISLHPVPFTGRKYGLPADDRPALSIPAAFGFCLF